MKESDDRIARPMRKSRWRRRSRSEERIKTSLAEGTDPRLLANGGVGLMRVV